MKKNILVEYVRLKETLKDYIVLRNTIGKVLNLEGGVTSSIKIKSGTKLRKIKKVQDKPLVYKLIDVGFPTLRFYILAKRLKWCNKKEVEVKMKEWLLEKKRNG